jgi:hypothetical protein
MTARWSFGGASPHSRACVHSLRFARPHQVRDLFPDFWCQAMPSGDKLV